MKYGYGTHTGKRVYRSTHNTREEKRAQERTERVRLAQLAVCLLLFITVFAGKGVFPEQMEQAGAQLMSVIQTNADFRGAFVRLGETLSEQKDPVLEGLGVFCVSVFASEQTQESDQRIQQLPPVPEQLSSREFLDVGADQNQLTAQLLGLEELPEELKVEPSAPVQQEPEQTVPLPQEPEPVVLKVGDVVQQTTYAGEPMPEQYTMEWLYLGEMETAVPVMGAVSSDFGYRDHPTIKRYALHGGVDIAAARGTAVHAFADGKVEYIGENDDFGLYLQIIHENGVKTFYAHCSKLCVKKGQQVSVGEKVAEVGSTGQSTGPHLHFEIKLDGVRLNPEYYIQTEREV